MMAANSPSNVSTLVLLIAVVTVVLSTNLSDAFVPTPFLANNVAPNLLQHDGFSTTSLYASTLPGSGLAVIDSWKLLPDGRIKGVMADTGDSVLTSPLKSKNGLKERATVRTVSGSRYRLGTPSVALSADRLGTPRATMAGVNNNRATQPLKSQDGLMQNFLDNKGRATMPLRSDDIGSTDSPSNGFLTPLVGGASAIAVGAAIGTGVVSDKGIDLDKVKNLPDPTGVLKSVKSLDSPDIKSLKAPVIPSVDLSLPKFEGLPSVSAPKLPDIDLKLPDINLPNVPDINLPEGIKMPDVPSVAGPVADKVKSLGATAGGALENAIEGTGIKVPKFPFAEKKPQINSVGQGPYRVPMPYLDRKIVEAEKERKAQEEAERALAAEKAEAARIQQIREEAQAEILARQSTEREQEAQKRAAEEARIKQEADSRVQKAEQEAARLRAEVEQTRQAALAKEKAAAEEAALLKREAEAAILKEQAAKEEFTQKLQEAELAKLKEAQDFSLKVAEVEQAAAKRRALEEEAIAKQRMAEEAASRQAVATAEVRKASIGATAARKAGYSSPSLSTYQAWQERQRTEYRTRIESVAEAKASGAVAPSSYSSSQDNLSTYQRWQQNVAAKQIVSMSNEPVKAAYITGAPAPVTNQLVSGTTKLSEAAIALNGDLGYVIAGSAALVAGAYYAYESGKIQEELSQIEATSPVTTKSAAPVSTSSTPVQPLPPINPPSPVVQPKQEDTTSVTMAIDANPIVKASGTDSASVTKAVSPPPPPEVSVPSTSATSASVASTSTVPSTPDVNNNGGSYLESMSKSSDGNANPKSSYSPFSNPKKVNRNDSLYNPAVPETPEAQSSGSYLESMSTSSDGQKSSYSPFSNPKKTSTNDSLYSAPSTVMSQTETYEEQSTSSDFNALENGESIVEPGDSAEATNSKSYLELMSTSSDGLKSSYSPFSNPKKTSNNDSLYSAPSTAMPQTEEIYIEQSTSSDFNSDISNNGRSYLESMSASSDGYPKSSYSPFSNPKKTSNNDSLYSAPSTVMSQTETYEEQSTSSDFNTLENGVSMSGSGDSAEETYSNASPYISPVDNTNNDEQTALNGASYFDSLSSDNREAGLKESYSPFQTYKVTANDSLYGPPPDTPSVPEVYEASIPPLSDPSVPEVPETSIPPLSEPSVPEVYEASTPPVSEESYPEILSSSSADSSDSFSNRAPYLEYIAGSDESMDVSPKTSYSPFSNTKSWQTEGDSLYDPPASSNAGTSTNEYSATQFSEASASNQESYLDALDDSSGSNLKKSYAPFGRKY